jgi:nitrogenase molybdenum-iron protein alpha/beta subunit
MGILWALAPIYDAAIIEFGSMGHMIYADKWMSHTGLIRYAPLIATHLTEKDIALGLTKRLEDCVKEVVKENKVKAIFLIPSSVPEMIGMDLDAVGEEIQFQYPDMPIITFQAGNFKARKEQGIEEAYYQVVKSLSQYVESGISMTDAKEYERKPSFNLFGSPCDWSRFQSDAKEISRMMVGAFGLKEGAIFGSSSNIESISKMKEANVTLVIRKEGLKAAKELQKRYKIPYLYLAPYGITKTLEWIKELEELLGQKANDDFVNYEKLETEYVINHCKEWKKYRTDKAKIWINEDDELTKGLQDFTVELGFTLEQGEIHMADGHDLKRNPGRTNIEIRRSTLSHDINPYELPFIGFRGAMNLSSLWYHHLIK